MFGTISRLAVRRSAQIDVNSTLEDVDNLRAQIDSLREERAAVEVAPRPQVEILASLDGWLDAAATEATDRLRLGRLLDRTQPVALTLPTFVDRAAATINAAPAVETLFGLLIATNRKAIRSLLSDQLSDLMADRPGLTDGERADRLAELDGALLATEFAEERAVRALEAAGVEVLRRSDASPLAVLADDAALPTA
jgi:hypothetical protein